ncbi:hypothetical protein GCM10022251_38530 [Phytohabitans flavus]|uniref:Short-chain dehydrogenase n=1 Tax=Phytohabitans flavus TaxID=1076124 RepID=A0A6F8XVF8_9ACTN|nr:SDR family NAD(P)-dependent oxidoreductase [Phytohabitans flavus]BCB77824.1 hypothetical protein Pflav_042340 [Phytohabitans flavus]
MRTIVITGGTDGLGRGLALHYLGQGERVIAVGSTQAKGDMLSAEAERLGGGDRMRFVRADLTSLDATQRLADTIAPPVDALVLCAQRYRLLGSRTATAEGHEYGLALGYLSRFLLSHALRPALEAASRPVIMNVGTPGVPLGRVRWDDIGLTRRYSGVRAVLQAFRANDLLAAGYGQVHPGTRISYVSYNPGVVATGMPGALPVALRVPTRAFFAVAATPVRRAIRPMVALLDTPPPGPFAAYWGRRALPIDRGAFDPAAARRLHEITTSLLADGGVRARP